MQDTNPAKPLLGLPQADLYGPDSRIHALARDYMDAAKLPYQPIRTFQKVDPRRAKRLANAYERMAHDPSGPAVRRSYDALASETLDQFQFVKHFGLKVELTTAENYPYKASPRMASADISNNRRLQILSTDAGYGSATRVTKEHLLLAYCDEFVDGERLRVNDIFRVVHDFFGHTKDGLGFRANGEENAWRSHSTMYSDIALGAMTSELRGQNTWANFGRYGVHNRTAYENRTVFAPQKAGLLPRWCCEAGRLDADLTLSGR